MDNRSQEELLSYLNARSGDMFEQALAMQALCTQYGYTQASLAKQLRISQSCVGNKIRLLQFSYTERWEIIDRALSERHARALLRVQPPKREKLIATVGNMHLTVQQTEELVEKYNNSPIDNAGHNIFPQEPISTDTYLVQLQNVVDRIRTTGFKATCLTESGEGWRRITITIVE